jgi:hypothetical protein
MLGLAEGCETAHLTPREWEARYAADVQARRADDLARIAGRINSN